MPTAWEPTIWRNQFWISQRTHCSVAYSLKADNLEAYSLAQPISDFATHSLHWSLQSGGLQSEGIESHATDSKPRNVLIARGLESGWLQSEGLQSRATDFGFLNVGSVLATYSLGAYNLRAYNLAQPMLDLATSSLH